MSNISDLTLLLLFIINYNNAITPVTLQILISRLFSEKIRKQSIAGI